ncbi:uncharacterized protein FIBRA_07146 [Fibroporia radiculosa]|uniref:SH3 domain-containing protein n=1 Tax=Fibroporia radiculosa TaxID=599839 RepID=J4H4G4_9APHY|nr:uncharacterized protein FIBRA_07146 [Fibroporia radiculosa]CCM04949.1 predicted protein [Fibroporia radiculosa]
MGLSMEHLKQRNAWRRSHYAYKRDEVPETNSTALLVGAIGVESSTPSGSEENEMTSGEKAITAVVVIVVLAIVGIVAWRVGKWRRAKARAASSKINISLIGERHGEKAVHIDFDRAGQEIEKPKMHVVLPTAPAASAQTGRQWTYTLPGVRPFPSTDERSSRSPPPLYTAAPLTATNSATSATRILPPMLNIPAGPQTAKFMMPSPRSASFGSNSPWNKAAPLTAKTPSKSRLSMKPLPRTMVVESTFEPSLADELVIKVGEQLRMLEEYEDEWCLAQHITGSPDAPKGVVPRFCLRELA